MGNREKFEIPTIAFTEVTVLNTPSSSTCSPATCNEYDPTKPGVLVNQNTGEDLGPGM